MQYSIPLTLIELEPESYHLLAEISIGDEFKGFVIIDTGASKTVFDEALIKPYSTNIELMTQSMSSGVNAMLGDCFTAELQQLTIGGFYIESYPTIIMNLQHLTQLYQQVAKVSVCGLLGSDFLVQHNAIINYPSKSMLIETNPE